LSLTWDPSYSAAASTGGFGFDVHALVGRHGPRTLQELLGGAARYFELDQPNHRSAPANATERSSQEVALRQGPVTPAITVTVVLADTPAAGAAPAPVVNLASNTSATLSA